MSTAFFISHPEVVVDAAIPVPSWRLSDTGIERMQSFAANPDLSGVGAVWASGEVKAIQAAELLAGRLRLEVQIHSGLNENDRSATGFLPPHEFELVADAFFADPEASVRGWERAIDAQARVESAVEDVLQQSPPDGNVAIVAHGGVGTLLLCKYQGRTISREADQPFQGHYWAFERRSRSVIHTWRSIAP